MASRNIFCKLLPHGITVLNAQPTFRVPLEIQGGPKPVQGRSVFLDLTVEEAKKLMHGLGKLIPASPGFKDPMLPVPIKVTDYERVAEVTPQRHPNNGLKYFACPKCGGICEQTDEKSYDCATCCRGWEETTASTVKEALAEAEAKR